MKRCFVVLILAICGAVRGTDIERVKEVIECVRKGINGGIPEIALPSLNPMVIPFRSIDINNYIFQGSLNFTNINLKGVVGFEVKELVDISSGEKDRAAFNYSVYWDNVRATGEYSQDLFILEKGHYREKAHINITLRGLHFSGVWDQSTGDSPQLNNFYLEPYAEDVEDNSYIIPDNFIERYLLDLAVSSFNNMLKYDRNELGDYISPILQDQLNQDWIVGGRDRIMVLLENCS